LIETKLIIWDEASMMNRLCFEAFDRTLRDIMKVVVEKNSNKHFGGKVVILEGNFRKILLVVKKGSRYVVNYSQLWKYCKVFKLSENMVLTSQESVESVAEIKEFVDWILNIGDGNMNLNGTEEDIIEIPKNLLIEHNDSPLPS